ncbi:hypothetical protein [Yersinia enterocolitica]|uniref:hypothetical protein n=1 Tax=Yersinia enterocolitica TaxID=630 RepID=UPI003D78D79A
MNDLIVPKNKIMDANNSISEIVVLIGLLKDSYTYEHPPEDKDSAFALSGIQKLACKLDANLFYLINDENGEAKS